MEIKSQKDFTTIRVQGRVVLHLLVDNLLKGFYAGLVTLISYLIYRENIML
jgi:hypothetical protein